MLGNSIDSSSVCIDTHSLASACSWAWSLDMGLAAREGEHAGGAACNRGMCHAAGSDTGVVIPTISAADLLARMEAAGASGSRCGRRAYVLVDVRPLSHFDLYSLAGSISLPLSVIERDPVVAMRTITAAAAFTSVGGGGATTPGGAASGSRNLTPPEPAASARARRSRDPSESEYSIGDAAPIAPLASADVYVICRRGVDSALATRVSASVRRVTAHVQGLPPCHWQWLQLAVATGSSNSD